MELAEFLQKGVDQDRMSSFCFTQRRQNLDWATTFNRYKRSSRKRFSAISPARSLFVAAMKRTSTLITFSASQPPDLAGPKGAQHINLGFGRHISDFIQEECAARRHSHPSHLFIAAPVKAPFSYPNNSLSSSVSGSAPQLSVTKGPSRPSLRWWIARATHPCQFRFRPSSGR